MRARVCTWGQGGEEALLHAADSSPKRSSGIFMRNRTMQEHTVAACKRVAGRDRTRGRGGVRGAVGICGDGGVSQCEWMWMGLMGRMTSSMPGGRRGRGSGAVRAEAVRRQRAQQARGPGHACSSSGRATSSPLVPPMHVLSHPRVRAGDAPETCGGGAGIVPAGSGAGGGRGRRATGPPGGAGAGAPAMGAPRPRRDTRGPSCVSAFSQLSHSVQTRIGAGTLPPLLRAASARGTPNSWVAGSGGPGSSAALLFFELPMENTSCALPIPTPSS